MTARSVVVSVPVTCAVYIWPFESVTWMFCAPEITWLLVTMWPCSSMIAPEPAAVPFCSVVWIETTDWETLSATAAQSTASPLVIGALPSPDLPESMCCRELVVGTLTQPSVIAM